MSMTIGDADPPGPRPVRRLQFGRYILDLDRGCLLLNGAEIALRPKTFAVLHCLIENSDRLVSKDQLFADVWTNLAVTDDVLVQSIGELGRALGKDGSHFIKTIPRRGYRFDSNVSAAASIPEAAANARRLSMPVSRRAGLLILLTLALILTAYGSWRIVETAKKLTGQAEYSHGSAGKNAAVEKSAAIAVVPLVNESGEPGREYFADGLTQDIINALGGFSSLTVMSWNAVFSYKGTPLSPDAIRRNLAVRYLVEGSVRQIGDRVQVTTQLIDTSDGRLLWSGRFNEAMDDIFALQDKITRQIVRALAIRVTQIEQRRVLAKPTASLEAYDYVLRARPASQHPTRANNVESRALLKHAIALDPNYAAAYAALAKTYYLDVSMGWAESPADSINLSEQLANKALGLDASEVRAHVILARIHIFHRDYRQAAADIDHAIASNPNDAQSLAGRGNILTWLGRTDAAIESFEQARRIDPELSAMDRFALALAYYLKGRYGAADEQAEINLRENADANFSRVVLASAYAEQNRTEAAARVVAAIHRSDPTFDADDFGSKLSNAADLEHVRDGLRKAHLYPMQGAPTQQDR
jgi:TolB-like protein/DNA-binding winged helix-turn-helix (wHTH) protein/cytochrome c-type biogenesis protein CcmH/NrfG